MNNMLIENVDNITDMNNFVPNAQYRYRKSFITYGNTILNMPSEITGNTRVYAEVMKITDTYLLQTIVVGNETTCKTYQRQKYSDWYPWYQVYNTSLLTDSALLSPLASALGVEFVSKKGTLTVDAQGTHVAIPLDKTKDYIILAYEENSDNYVFVAQWSKNLSTYGYSKMIGNKTLTISSSSGAAIWIENVTANTTIKYFAISFQI